MRARARALLGRLLVASIEGEPVDDLAARLGSAVTTLPALASYHGVGSFVFEALADAPSVPPGVVDELRTDHYRAALAHHQALADLALADRALRDAGIAYVVVKGPVLAEHVYATRGRRSYSDLDLVVAPRALPAATEALEASGFGVVDRNWGLLTRSRSAELHLTGPTGALIDLHWHLVNQVGLRATTAIDPAALVAEGHAVAVGDLVVPTLDPAATLVHVALHAASSGGQRLVWVKDVEQCALAPDLDWAAVTDRARAWRVVPAVALMLARARRTFGLAVPPAAWTELGPGRRYSQLVGPVDRLAPPARDRGHRNAARLTARSCRASTATSVRELGRRSWGWLTDPGDRLGEPDWIERDPANPGSPLFPDDDGGTGRTGYFEHVTSGRW